MTYKYKPTFIPKKWGRKNGFKFKDDKIEISCEDITADPLEIEMHGTFSELRIFKLNAELSLLVGNRWEEYGVLTPSQELALVQEESKKLSKSIRKLKNELKKAIENQNES